SLPTLKNHIKQKITQTQIRNTKSVDKYDEYSKEYNDDNYDYSRENTIIMKMM
ncbi:9305_t:CDS:1, partial [Gigaspora margarita]